MKPLYKISVRSHFSSAHSLRGYQGACERIHGHNWGVKVVVSGSELDSLGMSIDFKDLSGIVEEVVGALDHRYLDTLEEFKEKNPTAENLVVHIFREVKKRIPAGVLLEEVELRETEKYSVSYSE